MITFCGVSFITWGANILIFNDQLPLMKHKIYEWFGNDYLYGNTPIINIYMPLYFLAAELLLFIISITFLFLE